MAITDEIVKERFKERAKDGMITCTECLEIARELLLPASEIASTLTDMDIKIVHCQLGCFP